ncbi:hypothetical protein LTR17_026696 [Elasticomyces elasticus]|nr:hypothetical protein LTR17_026696 [Elasticomyces elasticus]
MWIQWYLEEHIRDMVYFGVAKKAAFYRASCDVLEHLVPPNDGNNGRPFLTLFQTDRKDALSYPEFREKVRQTTQLWGGKRGREVGEFKDEQVSLIEGQGSPDSNEDAAPHIIRVSIFGDGVEDKLQSEYVEAASKLDGYRRTLLYRLEDPPEGKTYTLFIHEFKSLSSNHLSALRKETEVRGMRENAEDLQGYETEK